MPVVAVYAMTAEEKERPCAGEDEERREGATGAQDGGDELVGERRVGRTPEEKVRIIARTVTHRLGRERGRHPLSSGFGLRRRTM
jgi:hypothetical protein